MLQDYGGTPGSSAVGFAAAARRKSVLLQYILFWRDAHIFFEDFNKIADVVETAVESSVRDGHIHRGELLSCAFNAVIIDVVDRGALCNLPKKTTEIFGVHACDGCERFQRDFLGIVIFNIAQYLL